MSSEPQRSSDDAQPATVALFVSDLHLSPAMPATAQAFLDFLVRHASRAQHLYLLGDIFEYWAGDDDLDDPFNRRIVDALRSLSDTGTRLHWIPGNRDFLVGADFATATGATLLSEPVAVTLAGRPLLLVHGDAQCTGDHAYMDFRQRVRTPAWQAAFLARPLAERKQMILAMREGSREAQRGKSMMIMDVEPAAIDALFADHGIDTLIHGHTHRPAVHRHGRRTRHVLPDWDLDSAAPRGGWLALDARGELHLVAAPAPDHS